MVDRIRRYGPREVSTAALAWVALMVAAAAVRIAGFRRTREVIARASLLDRRRGHHRSVDEDRIAYVALALDRAARMTPRQGRCLRRSLVLWTWLQWYGVDANIEFGVRRLGTDLMAHAWVSHGGAPVAEPTLDPVGQVGFGDPHQARAI